MPKRYDTETVRNVVGALDRAGVRQVEILRRLNADECGLGYKVPVKLRRVQEYRAEYRELHGPPERERDGDGTVHSIGSIEDRMLNLLAREVAHLEAKRPGKVTIEDTKKLNAAHRALVDIERRAKQYGKRDRGAEDKPAEPESVIDRLAREQREAV